MELSLYRKNVFKTLSVKPAKLGLRFVAGNTKRINVMHCAIGLHTEISEFVVGMSPVITGASRLTDDLRLHLFGELGDALYYTTVLAKELKVKLPSSTKKVKLKDMTRAAAAMKLLGIACEIGGLAKKSFYGPKMKAGGVPKTSPEGVGGAEGTTTDTSEKPTSCVVVDKKATVVLFAERHAKIAPLLEAAIPLMWALSLDLFGVAPNEVMAANISKLSKRYGEGFFTLESSENRDLKSEAEALAG